MTPYCLYLTNPGCFEPTPCIHVFFSASNSQRNHPNLSKKLYKQEKKQLFQVGILEKTGTDTRAWTRGHRTRTDGHGQTDTDRRHDAKDVQLWKTDRYGKGRQLWKTGIYGKDRKKVFKSEIFSRETHTVHNQYYTYCK